MLFQEMSSREKRPPMTEATPSVVSSSGRLSQQISAKRSHIPHAVADLYLAAACSAAVTYKRADNIQQNLTKVDYLLTVF